MARVYIQLMYLLATHLAWTLLRKIFCLCQTILWKLNGTEARIKRNFQDPSYKASLQVMKIICRYKFDPLGQPSGPSNFIASHESFVDPEYVLKENISLFYVNKDQAIWVEVEDGVDPTRCQYSAFFYFAQWKLAKKVLVMPLHVFNKLGQQVGRPQAKLIFLSNTSRCGSTLVTKVFAETKTSIAYSEPDCLNAITQLKGLVSDAIREKVFTNCINFLCKPIPSKTVKACVMKLTQPTMVEVPHIRKLFPESYHLFLYRNGLAVSKSLSRGTTAVPMFAMMQIAGRWSSTLTKKMVEGMGLHSDQFEEKLTSDLHFGTLMWAAAMRQYLDFRDQDINIVAARYEDIVEKPSFAFQTIFQHLNLPFDQSAVEVAMSEDSQSGTPIGAEKLKNCKAADFTDDVRTVTDKICDLFKLPRIPQTFIAPGTITIQDKEYRDLE